MATMTTSLLARKLIVVTGKGGTGKSTVAAAIGLVAASRGVRTIVAELGDQHRLPSLFEQAPSKEPDDEVRLDSCLWSTSIDPRHALFEWLRTIGGRMSVRMLAASSTFNYFAAAAPGAKELMTLIKTRELCERPVAGDAQGYDSATDGRRHRYDLVVLDAPATGHALAMLRSPKTFSAIVRVGPLADQAEKVRGLLESSEQCAYIGVTHATEMAVSETIELEEGLRRHLNRDLDAVFINGVLPRRFTKDEIARMKTVESELPGVAAALQAAQSLDLRVRAQQSQIGRLRRRNSPAMVLTMPLLFTRDFNLEAVARLADMLGRRL